MKTLKAIVLEKLKVSTKTNIDPQELFASVLDLLWNYGELDVKPLKLMCQYMHNNSHKIRSIDHIYYSDAPKSKKEWMMVMLDNDVSIRIDNFNAFHSFVFSKSGETPEEILNNILDIISK